MTDEEEKGLERAVAALHRAESAAGRANMRYPGSGDMAARCGKMIEKLFDVVKENPNQAGQAADAAEAWADVAEAEADYRDEIKNEPADGEEKRKNTVMWWRMVEPAVIRAEKLTSPLLGKDMDVSRWQSIPL